MNRPFPSCPSLCFKARLSAYLYEMIFNCLAKKTYFHKKGFARSKPHFESENFWNLATAYNISFTNGIYLISLRVSAYWKTLRVGTYFIKDGHLEKNL